MVNEPSVFEPSKFYCNLFVCISGTVRNLCPSLWKLQHLTKLYLNDNNLTKIPPDIGHLEHLHHLDLSSNKIRFLPPEIGDLIQLRELLLNYNQLRVLPFELGRLFNLQSLGEWKKKKSVYSVEPDKMVHNEPPYVDLHCSSVLWILIKKQLE